MSELEKFSVQDAKFRHLDFPGGETRILKEIKFHPPLQPYWEKIARWISDYAASLVQAGIPIPKILKQSATPEKIVYECEFKGPNIIQYLEERDLSALLEEEEILDQVLGILRKAQKSGLNFDPHIKNFVISDKKIFYVDFTPPWVQGYYDLRLSLASPLERDILTNFFKCMNPDVLGYHFASDLVKIDSTYEEILPELYERLREKELVEDSYADFKKVAAQVMENEIRREREGTFLL